jgi:hypothetical protein
MGRTLLAVFLDGQIAQHRDAAVIRVHETDPGHVGLDDVDLLQGRDDEQL